MARDTCKFCGCTDDNACDGGCSWADERRTVCSRCHFAAELADSAMPLFVALGTRVTQAQAVGWADLDDKNQQLLIMALRGLSEGIEEGVRADLTDGAVEATRELQELGLYIIEKFPEERAHVVESEESITDVAIRLLNHVRPALIVTG